MPIETSNKSASGFSNGVQAHSETPLDKKSPPKEIGRWWVSALGIAAAAIAGVVISRQLKPQKSPQPLKSKAVSPEDVFEWKLIEQIDKALERAGISGLNVYLKHDRVLLTGNRTQRDLLVAAKQILDGVKDIAAVEMVVKE